MRAPEEIVGMRAEIVAHLGATLALSDETGGSTVGYLIKMALEADHGSSSCDEDRLYSLEHPSVAQDRRATSRRTRTYGLTQSQTSPR
jgi:hypothetical protein